jgi:hypothetical protein
MADRLLVQLSNMHVRACVGCQMYLHVQHYDLLEPVLTFMRRRLFDYWRWPHTVCLESQHALACELCRLWNTWLVPVYPKCVEWEARHGPLLPQQPLTCPEWTLDSIHWHIQNQHAMHPPPHGNVGQLLPLPARGFPETCPAQLELLPSTVQASRPHCCDRLPECGY